MFKIGIGVSHRKKKNVRSKLFDCENPYLKKKRFNYFFSLNYYIFELKKCDVRTLCIKYLPIEIILHLSV